VNWKLTIVIIFSVIFIVFLNSLYGIFEFVKIAVFFLWPILILTWSVLFFVGKKKYIKFFKFMQWSALSMALYTLFTYFGFYQHNFTFVKKYQADETIKSLHIYKQFKGIYPKSLDSLGLYYIPGTEPGYSTDSVHQTFYLNYDVGIFEDAVYNSESKVWWYGD